MTVTLVSAVIDLSSLDPHRDRTIEWYVDHLDALLSTRHSLVLHADPSVVERIRSRREQLRPGAATRIVPTTFADLPAARHEPAIRSMLAAGDRPPTASNEAKDTAAYLALGWSKPTLLAEAVRADDGASSRYWWVDAHLDSVASAPPLIDRDDLFEAPRGSLHATVLWETSADEYVDRGRFHRANPFSRIAGGLFSIDASMATPFAEAMEEEIAHCVDGRTPTVDECLLGIVVDRLRESATLSYGPWESLLTDIDGLATVPWHRLRLLRDCRMRELDDRAMLHARALLDALDRGIELTPAEAFDLHDELLVVASRIGALDELALADDALRRALARDGSSDDRLELDEATIERVRHNLAFVEPMLDGLRSDPAQHPQ